MISKKLPHEIKSEETKNRLLNAVGQMLSEYDFKYLTVRNICEYAQVAYGSFYYHFANKENLLFTYTQELFRQNLNENPCPDWIAPEDFIKRSLWYVSVLGFFCEALGRDLTGYIHKNCPHSIFEETLDGDIRSILYTARQQGYLDMFRGDSIPLIIKDLEIICDGTLMWWGTRTKEETEPLHDTLVHLCFNMLFSFCSEKYRKADFPRHLITELPEFPGSIVIRGVPETIK